MKMNAIAALLLLGLAAAAMPAARAQVTAKWSPWGLKSSDKCVPFDPRPHATLDTLCAVMDGMSDKQLQQLWAKARVPKPTDGFPLRGCTFGCIPGVAVADNIARDPQLNMGWSGKCFSFDGFNQTTGTPGSLLNAFSPDYDYSSSKQAQRVQGSLKGLGSVYWSPSSYDDGRPVYTFNYSSDARPLFLTSMRAKVVISGIRDESRQIAPGAILGRMFVQDGSSATLVPVWFALFQACAADGTYPTAPGGRAKPELGGLTLPGGYVF